MSALYDTETGRRYACTIVQMDRVQVVAHKTKQKNGYYAVQVGSGWKHPSNVTRPLLGHYAEHGVSPKRHLIEFKVRDENGLLGIGEMIGPGWFQEGQFVDAKANSRGMGFAGGMKRHGFKGQSASHGVSLTHRSMGSSGQSQGGGSRVLPGKKMAGRMGNIQVTTQNVKVMKVDDEKGIVVLNGMLQYLFVTFIMLTRFRLHTRTKRKSGQAIRRNQEVMARDTTYNIGSTVSGRAIEGNHLICVWFTILLVYHIVTEGRHPPILQIPDGAPCKVIRTWRTREETLVVTKRRYVQVVSTFERVKMGGGFPAHLVDAGKRTKITLTVVACMLCSHSAIIYHQYFMTDNVLCPREKHDF